MERLRNLRDEAAATLRDDEHKCLGAAQRDEHDYWQGVIPESPNAMPSPIEVMRAAQARVAELQTWLDASEKEREAVARERDEARTRIAVLEAFEKRRSFLENEFSLIKAKLDRAKIQSDLRQSDRVAEVIKQVRSRAKAKRKK
jgi:hypothetical protein